MLDRGVAFRLAVSLGLACSLASAGIIAATGAAGAAGPSEQAAASRRSGSTRASSGQAAAPPGAPQKKSLARLAEPWPSPERLKERRLEAEQRPLFASAEPLAFTLRADFKAVNADRQRDSPKRHPATLVVAGTDGQPREIPVQLATRGRARLDARVCSVVPLKIEFPDEKLLAGTAFEGHDELKLVTHCRNMGEYEQYILREYLTYRVFNLFTPRSYRVRLARAVYQEAAAGSRAPDPHWAMFIEEDSDVARRMEGRIAPLEYRLFKHLHPDSLLRLMLLQYLVANTDFSIVKLHNVRLVQEPGGLFHPLTYDFDYAGLVDAGYGRADPRLGIASTRDRLYRGPCHPIETLEPYFEEFRTKKDDLLALYDSVPALDAGYRRSARRYIEEFYKTINSPGASKKAFVDGCLKAAGM